MLQRTRVFYIKDLGHGFHFGASEQDPDNAAEYDYAATILAENPDDAFTKLNRGSGQEDPVMEGQHLRSMSMGDVIYQGDLFYLCAMIGFRPLPPSEFATELVRMAYRAEGSSVAAEVL